MSTLWGGFYPITFSTSFKAFDRGKAFDNISKSEYLNVTKCYHPIIFLIDS